MEHTIHEKHEHAHGADCDHPKVQHAGHVDFLHDGHMHHAHDGHVDEHVLEVSSANPDACTTSHNCNEHDTAHKHGEGCGHDMVPHGDHVDHLVSGHLHHAHGTHCDDHGKISVA